MNSETPFEATHRVGAMPCEPTLDAAKAAGNEWLKVLETFKVCPVRGRGNVHHLLVPQEQPCLENACALWGGLRCALVHLQAKFSTTDP